jgi:TolB-like protein/DNA-binding SARP family transcriptional activator
MLQFRLLGGFELTLTTGSTPGRLGAKPQGLLAILAMDRGRTVSRSRLAGLLWGERGEDLARHSLNQALTAVRAALGLRAPELLLAEPEGVRLATGSFELDVDEFENAARSDQLGALAHAFQLYRGEFLEGLETREPGFDEWMLTERHRLNELAANAFGRLLDAQLAAGAVEPALETARKLVAMTPFDEAVHARLIQLYGFQGRRGLAEAHYARCSELLRRELGEAPGDALKAALREARRRSAARSAATNGGPLGPPADRPQTAPPRRILAWIKRRWLAPVAAATAPLLLGPNAAAPWKLASQPSIAVLPFVNLTGDPRQDWLVDGITRDIITDLSRFSTLFVISASSSFRYRGEAVKVQDVARDLGVRYVLEGSIGHAAGTLQASVGLIDATSGRHVWADRYKRSAADLFAVQKEISRQVATMIGSERGLLLQAELERIDRVPTLSLAAYELFEKGVHHRNLESRQDTIRARRLFQRAIALDPGYARALANLGLTYLDDIWGGWTDDRQAWLRKAEEMARRATEIDASEPTGYMVLGLVHLLAARHDQAIPLLEKAKALNPNDDHTLHALGYVLFYSGASVARGISLLLDVKRRNPHYPEVILRDLAQAYVFARRPEEALAALNQVARRHRPSYWLFKAASHMQLGELAEAKAAVAEGLRLDPDLTLEGEHERRLGMGLEPGQADYLTGLLREAGLPSRAAAVQSSSR